MNKPSSGRWIWLGIFFLLVSAACSATSDPDPGNRTLAALKRDPVRNFVPQGARLIEEKIVPKRLSENPIYPGQVGRVVRFFLPESGAPTKETLNSFEAGIVSEGWRKIQEQESGRPEVPPRYYAKLLKKTNTCGGIKLSIREVPATATKVRLSLYGYASLDRQPGRC